MPCLHSLFGAALLPPLNSPARPFPLYHPPLPYPLADAPRLLTMNAVHPYSDAQALVYSPQYTDPTHHRSSFHQSISPSLWSPSTHALMPSSSSEHARMYSLLHQPIHTLPYTAPSPAVFYNHQAHNNPQHQPRMQLSTPVPLDFSSQIESSIGPHRGVLTRRQARAAQSRGTPQPPVGQQQEGTENTSPSEAQDVRVLVPFLLL